ncbi:hypothetical protein U8C43_33935 (plasmid) [Sinorhizobium meliloti]|nr:hypothetical protein U8C30_33975 [Sinorhizobium meliloti]WQP29266.1 hypothetical protein U8C43_33935 [Sinorhizobium meliloti]
MAAYQKHQKSATSPTISGSFQYFKTDGNPLIEGVERFFSADEVFQGEAADGNPDISREQAA